MAPDDHAIATDGVGPAGEQAPPVAAPQGPAGSVPRGCALLVVAALLVSGGVLALVRAGATSPIVPGTASATATSVVPTPALAPPAVPTGGGVLAPSDVGFVDQQAGTGWGNRCWAHLRQGRYDWARAACERGLAGNPGRPYPRAYLLYSMGLIETHDGRPEVARGYLSESLALRPSTDVTGIAEVRKALASLGPAR